MATGWRMQLTWISLYLSLCETGGGNRCGWPVVYPILNNKAPKLLYLASSVLTTLLPHSRAKTSPQNPGADFADNLLVFCSWGGGGAGSPAGSGRGFSQKGVGLGRMDGRKGSFCEGLFLQSIYMPPPPPPKTHPYPFTIPSNPLPSPSIYFSLKT